MRDPSQPPPTTREIIQRARDHIVELERAYTGDAPPRGGTVAGIEVVEDLDDWLRDDALMAEAAVVMPTPQQLAADAGADEVMTDAELRRRIRDLENSRDDRRVYVGSDPFDGE